MVVANKMYVKKDFPIEAPFLSALNKKFNATAENVDFMNETTMGLVNAWVAEKTQGKIQNIASKGKNFIIGLF